MIDQCNNACILSITTISYSSGIKAQNNCTNNYRSNNITHYLCHLISLMFCVQSLFSVNFRYFFWGLTLSMLSSIKVCWCLLGKIRIAFMDAVVTFDYGWATGDWVVANVWWELFSLFYYYLSCVSWTCTNSAIIVSSTWNLRSSCHSKALLTFYIL